MEEIQNTISSYIAREILQQPQRRIAPDEALISSGLVDSFHLVDLAVFIEDQFGVHLDDTELTKDSFDTLNQLAALILSRR